MRINTDKYTGHTPAPWKADYSFPRYNQIQTGLVGPDGEELGFGYSEEGQIANAELIADAPLLLEEVKRLREEKTFLWETYLKESAKVKELQEMLNDFETKKTDMWTMRNRIETILKGDD